MSTYDSEFVRAIQEEHLVRIGFAAADGEYRVRNCAPMDIGPQRKYADKTPRYHLWDYESPDGPHTLSLLPEQVAEFQVLEAAFDPSEFVTWPPKTTDPLCRQEPEPTVRPELDLEPRECGLRQEPGEPREHPPRHRHATILRWIHPCRKDRQAVTR